MSSPVPMWAGDSTIPEERLSRAKAMLLLVIAATSVAPLFFVTPEAGAPLLVNVYKYLAKTGAFLGSMFMIWQFLLGFRGAISKVIPDLAWVVTVHRRLGQFGVPIILLHPIFIAIYYAESKGRNLFALDLSSGFSWLVLLGMVLLVVVAFIFVTSAFFRDRLGFYPWLYTHLSSYVVPPFLFVHSFLLGPTIQGTALRWFWWVCTALIAALYVWRIAHKAGATAAWYRVTSAREVAKDTTEILMAPEEDGLAPTQGQFVYVRQSPAHNSHPYSVSSFDDGVLGITVSRNGPQSAALQDAAEGDRLLLDGPFGVFTRPASASDQPMVLVAGGVGITAFRRLWQRLEQERDREAHLFYGNETYEEISYRDELDSLEHVNIVHVLNDEPDFDGETGFVDADVLERNLPRELGEYQFLMCGPAPMVLKLREGLAEAGVPKDRIREELFAS